MAVEGSEAGGDAGPQAAHQWQQTAHGKGRVRPRKNQPPAAQAALPRLAAVAHE